ncbi:3-methyl-2-oxobutanoate hydroxymethyltransferase [Caulobacter sp. S45]|uniref:3-methyl-2-oxobutanoate hydroxymethyltransferase n=1 Tax=Caulobacter sp. S45 TaxID=1641861 RepID=UPI00131B1D12|nr:3-methyl-2-oxobutanoate hydroxymethyltransferase [Caulobacter sp. S45]
MRTTLRDLQRMKDQGERIAMITAYDYPSARLADRAGAAMLLVGDSLGMVVHGHSTTLPVTLDDMVRHSAAVVRGAEQALVVGDLPFLTYASDAEAVASARRLMQEAGVQAVKLEGGAPVASSVRRLTELGVPVMGHLGFTPQAQHQLGLRVQGKDAAGARRLLEDALLLEASGAFAVVLELVPAPLAEAVTRRLRIPTIGIGAGAGCDGQVQVWHDLLGLDDGKTPRHAKRYADIGAAIGTALKAYVGDVRAGAFPTAAQSSTMEEAELAAALGEVH